MGAVEDFVKNLTPPVAGPQLPVKKTASGLPDPTSTNSNTDKFAQSLFQRVKEDAAKPKPVAAPTPVPRPTDGPTESVTKNFFKELGNSLFGFLPGVGAPMNQLEDTYKPANVEKTFEGVKSKVADVVDSPVTSKVANAVFPTKPSTSTVRNLPAAIAENLPFGWGQVVQNVQTMTDEDLMNLRRTSAREMLEFTGKAGVDTAKGSAQAPVRIAAQVRSVATGGKRNSITLPVLGETKSYTGEVNDQMESYDPEAGFWKRAGNLSLAVLTQVPNIIFDILFVAGAAQKVFAPREATILSKDLYGKKPVLAPKDTLPGKSGARSFRNTKAPDPTYIPIEKAGRGSMVHDELAIRAGKKYNPENPTFMKMTLVENGMQASIVQIKPSLARALMARLRSVSEGKPASSARVVPETVLDTGLMKPEQVKMLVDKTVLPKPGVPVAPTAAMGTLRQQFGLQPTPEQANISQPGQTPAVVAPTQPQQAVAPTQNYVQPSIREQFGLPTVETPVATPTGTPAQPVVAPQSQNYVQPTIREQLQPKPTIRPGYPDNIKLAESYPAQRPETTRIYTTNRPLTSGQFVDTNFDMHTGRGTASEPKYVADIPDSLKEKYLVPVDPARTAQGEFRLAPGVELPSKFIVYNGENAKSQYKAEPPPFRFTSDDDMLLQIRRPKEGHQGLQLNETELRRLNALLADNIDPTHVEKRGIIYKPYGYVNDRKPDLILGEINHNTIVAELTKEGKVTGRVRIHGTPLNRKEIITKLGNEDLLKRLGTGEAPKAADTVKASRTPAGAYASRGSEPIGKFEQRAMPKAGTPEFKLFEQVEKFISKYAERKGEKYLPRGARGVFYHDTTNIFLDGLNDVSTAAHEVTHYVDFTRTITDNLINTTKQGAKVRNDLTALYEQYYPGGSKNHQLKKRVAEGLATFIQKYIEQPTTITKQYPDLVRAFLEPGGQHYDPVFTEMLKDMRQIVDKYQGLSALDKIGSRVATDKYKHDKKSFMTWRDKLRTELTDNIFPLEKLDQLAGKAGTQESVSLFARMYNNMSAPIMNNLQGKRGFWTYKGGEFVKAHDFNYRTLVEQLVKKNMTESFGYFLVGRDTHFNYEHMDKLLATARLLEGGAKKALEAGDLSAAKQLSKMAKEAKESGEAIRSQLERDGISRVEAKAAYTENAELFKEEAQMFDALVRSDLDFLHDPDVQLINSKQYSNYTSREGYASKRREFYNDIIGNTETVDLSVKIGKTKVSALMRRKGSAQAITNPLFSAMKNHAEIMKKGMKQVVYNKVLDISKSFPDLFQRQELKAVPDNHGAIHFPQENDKNIIMARKHYKRVPVLTDDLVKRTVDEVLNHQLMGTFEQVLISANRIFTKGTTGAFPAFAAVNLIVDQFSATAQTMNNYTPIYDNLKEMAGVLKPNTPTSRYFNEYMVLGGERQTLVGWQDLPPSELFRRIARERNGLQKTLDALETGANILSAPSKYSEIVTRATEYIKARKAGKPQLAALEEAGRVTAPFHHIGSFGGSPLMRTFVKSLSFANAGIQVLDQALRSIESDNGRRRYLFVAAAVTAAIVASFAYIMKSASDEQKQQLKDTDPRLFSQYIFIPKHGGSGFFKVRIPQQLSVAGALINMALIDQATNVDYSFGEYVGTTTSFLPDQLNPTDVTRWVISLIPQILKPVTETAFGVQDYPSVHELESPSLKNFPTADRANESTSPLAKWLSPKFSWLRPSNSGGFKDGLSPIEIDFLLTGYFGRSSGFVTGKPGIYNPLQGVNADYYFRSGRTMQAYYDVKQSVAEGRTSISKKLDSSSDYDRADLNKMKARITVIDKKLDQYKRVLEKGDVEKATSLRDEILDQAAKLETEYNK